MNYSQNGKLLSNLPKHRILLSFLLCPRRQAELIMVMEKLVPDTSTLQSLASQALEPHHRQELH